MGIFRGPNIVREGLILNLDASSLRSYPGSGTVWTDLGPNNLSFSLINGTSYNSSNKGVMYFDTTDDYATASAHSSFAFGTGDFTIDAWVKPTQLSNTYTHILALPQQDTFALKINVNGGEVYFYSTGFTTYGSTNGWTVTQDQWNHVVLVRSSSVAYAYLNGVSKGSKSGFSNSFSSQTINIHNGWGSEYAEMYLGPLKVYNTALSSDQVLQNYNAHKERFGL